MLHLLIILTIGASLSASRVIEHGQSGGHQDAFAGPPEMVKLDVTNTNWLLDAPTPCPQSLSIRHTASPDTDAEFQETKEIPFPKQDWHGLRVPNYTDLYLNYTEPVHCIRTWQPIGFYGYMTWLVSLIIMIHGVLDSVIEKDIPFVKFVSEIASAVFFVISVARASTAYSECARKVQIAGGSYVVKGDKVTYAYNSFAFLYLSGPLIVELANLAAILIYVVLGHCLVAHPLLMLIVFIVRLLALLAALALPFFFYSGYTLFLYADDSLGAPIACVVISIILLFVCGAIYIVVKYDREMLAALFSGYGLFLIPLVFHLLCVGISYILLGRTVDDPWGGTSCSGPLGAVQAALDGIIPVITTITSILMG